MIYNCKNCMAALLYNPEIGKLQCLACESIFETNEFEESEEKAETAAIRETEELKRAGIADDLMECNIYSCTACGAELAVNGVETSTFCSYCGQPTIVFSRVSSTKKPHYIIPFSVTKDQAVATIRKHISSGFFVPNEIRNFSIERVRGIYVPFWLYDINYSDEQYLSGRVKSGKHTYTKYFFRAAETTFYDLTLDASHQLSDESSQRLEPYDTSELQPFEPGYLSGFYADCFDMSSEVLENLARARSMKMFNKEIENSIRASNIKILSNEPHVDVTNSQYAMFPAWFLTFRYQNDPYTILVNGQTNKVVGAVPYNKAKVNAVFWSIGILASVIISFITHVLLVSGDEDTTELVIYFILAACLMWGTGSKKFKRLKKSIELSKSSMMNHFVKDRQEG